MENNQVIMMKEKLGFFGIIKQSLKIIPKNPKFIILTFLTSFPLFIFLLFLEFHLQQYFTQIINLITSPNDDYTFNSGIYIYSQQYRRPTDSIRNLIQDFWKPFLFLILLYLGIGHVLDLINTITIIHSASKIYGGQDKETLNLKEMLKKVRIFKGPLVTSIYVLILSSLTWIGFLSILMHYYMMGSFNSNIVFLKVVFVLAFLGLLTKYMEWSGIWNMGMVISVLEEKHGDVAIGVSAYISRGSRRRGCLLMFVFFTWKVLLRLICFYGVFVSERKCMVVFTVGLVCVANVVKWVVFTVYFYDCKKRFLEKKVDVEQGTQAQVS